MNSAKGRNPNCQKCSLHESAEYVCLFGRGPVPCDVMVIGEAPGHREDDIGKPFQGQAGQLLDQLLSRVGLSRTNLYITNAVRCRPPNNRTPTPTEIKACSEYTRIEMEQVKPKFVLLLGSVAMKALLRRSGITEHHGRIVQKDGIYYFPTFHPAAALRDPSKISFVEADLRNFVKLIKSGRPDKPHSLNLRIINSSDEFNRCIDDLINSKIVSFDIETTGLEWYSSGEILCLGLATRDFQWILPLHLGKFSKKLQEKMVHLIADTLTGKKVIGHNAKFDNLWLRKKFGVRFPLTFDTMLAAHLLDENNPVGLKYLARVHLGAYDYDLEIEEKRGKVNPHKLYEYCAYDVYYTRKLYFLLKKRLLEDEALARVFALLIMPAAEAFENIEERGVFIDRSRMAQVEEQLKKKIEEAKAELDKYAGEEINWNSPKQVATLLFDKLKLPILHRTESGSPSTSESVIKRLDHPISKALLAYREAQKQLTTFIEGWKEKLTNSRLHPSFKLHGTVTGRLSCENPNLQQVPRDATIRSLISAEPGWTFVEADYSQIELRVAAELSGDRAMKMAFQTGEDIHTKTAQIMTGKHEISKEERKKAKAINFGLLYGMGAEGLREYARDKYEVDMSLEEAQEYRWRFFELYSGLPKWHERQRKIARNYQQVRTLIGRIRHLPGVISVDNAVRAEAERQAINSPVQSFASDLMLMSLVEIHNTIPKTDLHIIGSVHDAILFEVRTDVLNEILPKIKKIMEHPRLLDQFGVELTVPIEVEIKVGPWGEGKVWN